MEAASVRTMSGSRALSPKEWNDDARRHVPARRRGDLEPPRSHDSRQPSERPFATPVGHGGAHLAPVPADAIGRHDPLLEVLALEVGAHLDACDRRAVHVADRAGEHDLARHRDVDRHDGFVLGRERDHRAGGRPSGALTTRPPAMTDFSHG